MLRPLRVLFALAMALTLATPAHARRIAIGIAAIPIIVAVEPASVSNMTGGVISVIGNSIATGTVVRLVDFGVLTTEYVNTGSLRATVPAGMAPRRYAIELIEPDGTTVATTFSIEVYGQAPTPAPTNPPPTPIPGKPLVALRNFQLEPAKPIVGREFTLTVELYNTGSRAAENTLVTFPGGNFTPLGAQNGYLLGQMPINGSARLSQRFRVPTGLLSQLYELKFNVSSNDYTGENFQNPQTVPVEVIGVWPGKPQLVIEGARTDPPAPKPGQPFALVLDVYNRGSRVAVNTLVSVMPLTDVLPSTASNVINIDLIGIDHHCDFSLPLMLTANAAGGARALEVALDYSDYVGTQAYGAKQTVSINVPEGAAAGDRPQLVLTGYQSDPPRVAPGEVFTLTYTLTNVGGGAARRLVASLGGENGVGLKPFAPFNSGNVKYAAELAGGASIDVVQPMIAEAAAESGAYNLPLSVAFDDGREARKAETQVLSLLIRRVPQLRVVFSPPIVSAGMGAPIPLTIDVVNISRKPLNINVVELSSDQLAIENGTLYFGVLDGGSTNSLQATGTANAAGPATVSVTINYLDEFNQPQQIVRELPLVIEAAPAEPPGGAGATPPTNPALDERPWIVRVLSALFGLGS